MIVLDASVVIEFLLGTTAGGQVARHVTGDASLHAPHLLDLEVAQVLRRYVRTRELTPSRASAALDDLLALPVARYPHEPLLARIWELRDRCTVYDAAYLALAEALHGTFLTRDRALASAAPRSVSVVVV